MKKDRAAIAGIGMWVPERIVTNEELAPLLGTSPEWIEERTGIHERRYADSGVSTSDIAIPAALQALRMAKVEPKVVDMIVFATLSPDHHFPGAGCYFQAKLGLVGTPVLDVRNQCSGFLYGLQIANALILSRQSNVVLVVGAEVHSHALDISPTGRDVAALFGDGAGAVVVCRSENDSGIESIHLHADGRFADSLCQKIWDVKESPYIQHEGQVGVVAPDLLWASMKGQEVFRWAIRRLTEAFEETCKYNKIGVDDIDLFIPHQANRRINEQVAAMAKIPEDIIVHTIEYYGNTTAASIPMAMRVAYDQGILQKGTRAMLAAFGSGFTWGSAYVKF